MKTTVLSLCVGARLLVHHHVFVLCFPSGVCLCFFYSTSIACPLRWHSISWAPGAWCCCPTLRTPGCCCCPRLEVFDADRVHKFFTLERQQHPCTATIGQCTTLCEDGLTPWHPHTHTTHIHACLPSMIVDVFVCVCGVCVCVCGVCV